MNFAVLLVPDFALHALRRSEPALLGQPVALIAGEGRKAVLTEVSPEAIHVAPGLAVTLAMARCPGLVLRPRDPAAEVEAQRLLLAVAFTLSPRVEATAAGCCTVDLQGADAGRTATALRLGVATLARTGLPAQAGTAATPLLATYAARHAILPIQKPVEDNGVGGNHPEGGSELARNSGAAVTGQPAPVCVVSDARDFLRNLPLAVAEPTADHAEILRNWGLKTLGDLTALTKADVGARLGAEGVALWERAAGETTRVLRLTEPARSFVAAWEYDPPVDMLEPLVFKLQRFAERIVLELRATGLVAQELALTLQLEDGGEHRREFRLPEPGADVASWMRVLLSHLETVRLDARLAGARLSATPARPQQRQDGLFDTGLRDPAAFWENLARLGAIVGDDRIGTPVRLNTHRPDAFFLTRPAETVAAPAAPPVHPARGLALRRFRPPWPVQVTFADARPAGIAGALTDGVVAFAGPWRSDGDWWRPETWAVETWQVELAGGGVYQLAHTAEGWCVEGVLD